jgi:DNA invertase Pin-like site-specific DNA recombinase
MDGQKEQLRELARAYGLRIKKFYIDTDSALGEDNFSARPGFLDAMQRSLETGWPIICASADRFSRTCASYDRFVREGGKVYSADIGFGADDAIMRAAIRRAEVDGRRISHRTREGQRRAKEKGVRFGNPRLEEARRNSAAVRSRNARLRRDELQTFFRRARSRGAVTHRQIAEALNKDGVKTAHGRNWTEAAVRITLTKIRRDGFSDHEASVRAEAERTAVVGAGNRIANAAIDDAALQERDFKNSSGKRWTEANVYSTRRRNKLVGLRDAGRTEASTLSTPGIVGADGKIAPDVIETVRAALIAKGLAPEKIDQAAAALAAGALTEQRLRQLEKFMTRAAEKRRAQNSTLDDAALQKPNATPLDGVDDRARDRERDIDELVRRRADAAEAQGIIVNRADLYALEKALKELDELE